MQELELKYGVNPNQKPAKIYVKNGALPIEVLNGRPGYINFMDAFNGWQLVKELKEATGLPAATSFKHVSPAGASVASELDDVEKQMLFALDYPLSPLASAYVRARGADRMSSFGDWVSLSDICDEETALFLQREVSDGIIAPGYTPKALEILKSKRKGAYNIVQIDPSYVPAAAETREIYGVTFEQGRNDYRIDAELFTNIVSQNKDLPETAVRDLIVAMITLKYTQSNSVCYTYQGQAIGIGAGQQSRIHCTRLAGNKADNYSLRKHPKVLSLPFRSDIGRPDRDNAIDLYISATDSDDVLRDGAWQNLFTVRPDALTAEEKAEWLASVTGVSLGSDAFFPFSDNIDRACKSGVRYIAEPGGSKRDGDVIECCDRHGVVLAFTGMRLFHH